jgi:hypothetical protein
MAASAWTPVDESKTASAWTPVEESKPAAKPSFFSDPKAYLQNQSQEMGQAAQNQQNQAFGPESQGKSTMAQLGHRLASLGPETVGVIDKMVAGGMDWKNALVIAAGAVDPAIPAAYFGTQGAAQLGGVTPGVNAGDTSPENVQNALLAGSMVAGAGGTANAPGVGRPINAVGNISLKGAVNAITSRIPQSPLTQDAIGLVSPRAAHALKVAQRIGNVADKYVGADPTSPKPSAPTTVEEPPAPAATSTPSPKVPVKTVRQAKVLAGNVPLQQSQGLQSPEPTPTPNDQITASAKVLQTKATPRPPVDPAKLMEQAKALRGPTNDTVTQALPDAPKSLQMRTQAEVDFYLRKGNIEGAQAALDKATGKKSDFPPPAPTAPRHD